MRSTLEASARNVRDEGNIFGLTAREVQVLSQVISGASSKEIGIEMGVSPRTVDTHRYNIRQKTGAYNRSQLNRVAKTIGIQEV